MAVYTNAGGGGGASSDELTAARGDVLKGKTAVTSDSSDEPVEGTLELTGDAADSHVLTGKTYYNKDPKTRRTGTMPNRGAVAQELAAGGSYTIPEGYHNGGGKVTVKSLASQTGGATATDGDVLSGRTYWKDGAKRTGTMANQGAKTASLNAGGSYAIPAGYHNGSGRVTANSLASQTSANAAAGHILSGKTAWVNGSKLTGNIASMGGQTITPTESQQTVSCSGKYMTGNIVVKGVNAFTQYKANFTVSTERTYVNQADKQISLYCVAIKRNLLPKNIMQLELIQTTTNSSGAVLKSFTRITNNGSFWVTNVEARVSHNITQANATTGDTIYIPCMFACAMMDSTFIVCSGY